MTAEEFINIVFTENDHNVIKKAHDEFMKTATLEDLEVVAQSGAGEMFYMCYGYFGKETDPKPEMVCVDIDGSIYFV